MLVGFFDRLGICVRACCAIGRDIIEYHGASTRGGICTPLLYRGGENHPAAQTTRACFRPRARAPRASPVAMRAGRGLAQRRAASEEKTRNDEMAEPKNTTRLLTMADVYLDKRPTSERRHADRAPRERVIKIKNG